MTYEPSDEVTTLRLTYRELWHLFLTMSGAVAAGSECLDDVLLARKLARAHRRRGIVTAGMVPYFNPLRGWSEED